MAKEKPHGMPTQLPQSGTAVARTACGSSLADARRSSALDGLRGRSAHSVPGADCAATQSQSSASSTDIAADAAAAGVAVRVAVRVRPPLGIEARSRRAAVRALPEQRLVRVGPTKAFEFDDVFGADASQSEVYDACVAPLVKLCADGYNATCLAYGQTGSGKTYTMYDDARAHAPTVGERAGGAGGGFGVGAGILAVNRRAKYGCGIGRNGTTGVCPASAFVCVTARVVVVRCSVCVCFARD